MYCDLLPLTRGYVPVANTFGELLKNLRTQKGWSLEFLGEKVGVSHVSLGDWERGKRNPKRKNLESLALAFGDDKAIRDSLFRAAGYLGKDQTEITLESGKTYKLLGRGGDPSLELELTPEVTAIMEQLAVLQDARKKDN